MSISADKVVATVNNSGDLTIEGRVTNLITLGGKARILGTATIENATLTAGVTALETTGATLPETLTVQANAEFVLEYGASTLSMIVNNGKATIYGTAIAVTNNAGGNLLVDNGANITLINSAGQTQIENGAIVSDIFINAGHTDVKAFANVDNVTVNDGTLEVRLKANLAAITQNGGTIIDHRAKLKMFIIIVASVGGGILLLLLILIPILVAIKKSKNSRASKIYSQLENRVNHNKTINRKKIAVNRYRNIKNITTNSTRSVVKK